MEIKSNKTSHPPVQGGSRCSYQVIPYQIRKELIHRVMEQGFSIYRAAKNLNVNHSTAKVIVRKFKKSGVIFKRKMERNQLESFSFHGEHIQHQEIRQTVEETPASFNITEVSPQTGPTYFWFLLLNPEANNYSFMPQYYYM